jgi:hypothetical protein
VWSIRAKLQLERRLRNLALFTLGIDSKLRGCDLIALCVSARQHFMAKVCQLRTAASQ